MESPSDDTASSGRTSPSSTDLPPSAPGQKPKGRKGRPHNIITDVERRSIREQHRNFPALTQKQLAEWATQEFGKKFSQSTISDSLQMKYAFMDLPTQDIPVSGRSRKVLPVLLPRIQAATGSKSIVATREPYHLQTSMTDQLLRRQCAACGELLYNCVCHDRSLSEVSGEAHSRAVSKYGGRTTTGSQIRAHHSHNKRSRRVVDSYSWAIPGQVQDNSGVWFPRLIDAVSSSIPSHNECTETPNDLMAMWFYRLTSVLGKNRVLDETLKSFTIYHIGMTQNDEAIIQKSRMRYGNALYLLRRTISSPNRKLDLELVMAIMLMALFECLEGNKNNGWMKHIRAAADVLVMIGPSSFSGELAILFLKAFRRDLVIASHPAIEDVHPLISNESYAAYRMNDWGFLNSGQFIKAAATPIDHSGSDSCIYTPFIRQTALAGRALIEIFTGMTSAQSSTDLQPHISRAIRMKTDLREEIKLLWEIAPPLKTPSRHGEHDLYPTVYTFENLCHASCFRINWNFLIGANTLLGHIHPSEEYAKENQLLADELCRSLEYVAGAGFLSVATLAHDMVAVLENSSPETCDWIHKRLDQANMLSRDRIWASGKVAKAGELMRVENVDEV